MKQVIFSILEEMADKLNAAQMRALQQCLIAKLDVQQQERSKQTYSNQEYLKMFLAAKKVEGCSARTLAYYQVTAEHLIKTIQQPFQRMTTEDLRQYFTDYQKINDCSLTTIDNIRRNLSSLFSWLEEEDYILKNPIRRIHKVRTGTKVKDTFSDETLEQLRDQCHCLRDLALVDFLSSTGVRVGELVRLNRQDINFADRECIVYGKGNKERRVYFDAKTKLHLWKYLKGRKDDNPALFVTLDAPHDRLQISGVEIRLRQLGRSIHIEKVHPHKFRRSMATRAIDKGMPIEQVQKLLGHQQIDTTMHYAMVNQNNVRISHQKYLS